MNAIKNAAMYIIRKTAALLAALFGLYLLLTVIGLALMLFGVEA